MISYSFINPEVEKSSYKQLYFLVLSQQQVTQLTVPRQPSRAVRERRVIGKGSDPRQPARYTDSLHESRCQQDKAVWLMLEHDSTAA